MPFIAWYMGFCLMCLSSFNAYSMATYVEKQKILSISDLKQLTEEIKLPDLSKIKPVNPFKKQLLSDHDTPLNGLQFVGILRAGKEVWGIIKQPDGRVFSVKAGDSLSNNTGRALIINDQAIVIQQIQRVGGLPQNIILTRQI